MVEPKIPDILGPLWSGKSIWCKNCNHHVNCHQTGRVPLCDYDASGSNGLEKGRIECNCKQFQSN